jgi:pilus assembly protein Flp/PilA
MYKDGNRSNGWRNLVRTFAKDEGASTAIEYALIGSLVAVGIIIGVTAVGTTLRDQFYNGYAGALAGASGSTP